MSHTTASPSHATTRKVPRRTARATAISALFATALLVSGCGAGGSSGGDRPATTPKLAPASTAAVPAGAAAPSLVVRTTHALELHQAPDAGSAQVELPPTTELGSQTALLVTEKAEGWVKVLVPGRPTGGTAWVATDDVELRTITMEVRVDLAARTLEVRDGEKVVRTTPVAIGAADTPTPTGRFSVTDKLDTQRETSAYGPFALGLSGRSDVLTEFAGGDGQIGIHGTNDPASIGNAVSHGCIRVPNDVITTLSQILPLGTPVVVG